MNQHRRIMGATRVAVAIFVATVGCLTAICLAQGRAEVHSVASNRLREFLRKYVDKTAQNAAVGTYYTSADVDLNGDGKNEVIVYLTGNAWCGSGGCTVLILALTDSSFDVVGTTTVVRLPIRVSPKKSHGWDDIIVRVQGGGITHAYDAVLPFNGKTYPHNPTVPPAVPAKGAKQGRVVIPLGAKGVPLYD